MISVLEIEYFTFLIAKYRTGVWSHKTTNEKFLKNSEKSALYCRQ